MLWKYLNRYQATLFYLATIVVITKLFAITPYYTLAGEILSPFDALVGAIYVFRNFAQREIGHWVIVVMAIAAILSFILAEVADATTYAFLAGEIADLVIFSCISGPLLKRVLLSAVLSSPIDSFIFLFLIDRLNGSTFLVMTSAKMLGVFVVIILWQSFATNRFHRDIS